MSHYPPDTASGETLRLFFLGFFFRREWLKRRRGTRVENEFQRSGIFGMITVHQICIPTGTVWFRKNYPDTISNCRRFLGFFLIFPEYFFLQECFLTLSSRTAYRRTFLTLAGPWPHLAGIYLEPTRESVAVQHGSLGAHEQAHVPDGRLNEKTRLMQRTKCDWESDPPRDRRGCTSNIYLSD